MAREGTAAVTYEELCGLLKKAKGRDIVAELRQNNIVQASLERGESTLVHPLRVAAALQRGEVFAYLWTIASPQQRREFRRDNGTNVFHAAAASGNVKVLECLVTPIEKSEVENDTYAAYAWTAVLTQANKAHLKRTPLHVLFVCNDPVDARRSPAVVFECVKLITAFVYMQGGANSARLLWNNKDDLDKTPGQMIVQDYLPQWPTDGMIPLHKAAIMALEKCALDPFSLLGPNHKQGATAILEAAKKRLETKNQAVRSQPEAMSPPPATPRTDAATVLASLAAKNSRDRVLRSKSPTGAAGASFARAAAAASELVERVTSPEVGAKRSFVAGVVEGSRKVACRALSGPI
jgi:hypothetical protein